ncbi:hypothetical protein AB0N89_02495 [Amycolatopsis sp. NPDC089917]|uniref:hypothetical protein n=1 Tax=Amycolatopsis sp. NPDC089917 TaxID=3155187 RepID=UPI00344482AF
MSLVRDHADWIRLCDEGRLSDSQQVLLETVLAACDPEVVLTRHVAGTGAALTAIARVESALESRARPSRVKPQPYASVTLDLISTALAVFESTRSVFVPGTLDSAISVLSALDAGGQAGLKAATDCANAAMLLAARIAELRSAVRDHLAAAWRGAVTVKQAERLALEMAALCVMENRWHPQLTSDVRTALSQGSIDAEYLAEVLLPAERDFRVAVVVEGTSSLESLARLMDPSADPIEIMPGEALVGWGHGKSDLQRLVDLADAASIARRDWSGDQANGHVLLTFTVRARDSGGAILLGRRQASELLDQYVAGQRIAEIRLRAESLAYEPGTGRVLRLAMPVLGTGRVRPLSTTWPPALRESLRTSHIARITEAPMASAGLCWAALEALEVKPNGKEKLARALSLQALRQQVVDLHQRTRTAVAAALRATRAAHSKANASYQELARAVESARREKSSALAEKAAMARSTERARYEELERALEAEALLAQVDVWTGVGHDGRLRDPSRWFDVLAAPADAEPELRAAADATACLADCLRGQAASRLRAWLGLLATPKALAGWIEGTAARCEGHLEWLYALRNIALHDGRFESTTDILDAHAGRALLDLALEFLGNWYEQATSVVPERAAWPALEVIDHLAERQEKVVAALRSGTRAGLHLTHLTSPTSTGLDRR